jgi:hypothetical protein
MIARFGIGLILCGPIVSLANRLVEYRLLVWLTQSVSRPDKQAARGGTLDIGHVRHLSREALGPSIRVEPAF